MNLTYEYLEQNYDIVIEQREDRFEADLMSVLRGAAAIDAQEPMHDDGDFFGWLKCHCERVSIDGPQLFVKARLESSLGAEYDVTDDKSCKAVAFDYGIKAIKQRENPSIYYCESRCGLYFTGTLHQAVYGVIAQLSAEEHQYSS